MKSGEIIRFSSSNLMHRGLRSWLTVLGIVIGVAAVVSIISIGTGTQEIITSQLSGLGADILTISPGSGRAVMMGGGMGGGFAQSSSSANLTIRDVQTIKTVSGVKSVNGMVSGRADAIYMSQTSGVTITGVDPTAWKDMATFDLDSGRFLTQSDTNSVVIGYRIANSMFKQPLTLNSQISIEGKSFKVVGIIEESGGMSTTDSAVFMTNTMAWSILEDSTVDQYNSIQVQISDEDKVNETATAIESKLMILRHVTSDNKDFTVTSMQTIQETISSITNTLEVFLVGIAAISLLVGAIGIANTMFMSVLERTKQIGVLKSLGATNFEIAQMFVAESSMLGLIGGLLGLFLGFIASGVVSEAGSGMMSMGAMRVSGSITSITPDLIIFALLFSVIIGALSGFLPARRAAKLQPVEALRYE
jgi:putative ABC transport system permease protein